MATEFTSASSRGRRAGVRTNEAGEETRERLVDSAERLFAQRGLDAVSVRDITEAAGANTASIHYHFGSKLDLIAAVMRRRVDDLGARRSELLDALERDRHIELRTVVEALVLPTAELASRSEGGRSYVAFMAALGNHPELMPMLVHLFDSYTGRLLDVLARVTPDLPEEVRGLRFAVSKDLINRIMGEPHGQIRLWLHRQVPGADESIIDCLIDMIVGIFTAPISEPRFGNTA